MAQGNMKMVVKLSDEAQKAVSLFTDPRARECRALHCKNHNMQFWRDKIQCSLKEISINDQGGCEFYEPAPEAK